MGFNGGHLDRERRARLEQARAFRAESSYCPSDVAQRQQAWLNRSASDNPADWSPPKLHREAAQKVLIFLDNIIEVMTIRLGLIFFQFVAGHIDWQDWRSWPNLGLCIDFGSDGLCAWHVAAYSFGLYMILWPDHSHLNKCAFEGVLKAVNLWNFWLRMRFCICMQRSGTGCITNNSRVE